MEYNNSVSFEDRQNNKKNKVLSIIAIICNFLLIFFGLITLSCAIFCIYAQATYWNKISIEGHKDKTADDLTIISIILNIVLIVFWLITSLPLKIFSMPISLTLIIINNFICWVPLILILGSIGSWIIIGILDALGLIFNPNANKNWLILLGIIVISPVIIFFTSSIIIVIIKK